MKFLAHKLPTYSFNNLDGVKKFVSFEPYSRGFADTRDKL